MRGAAERTGRSLHLTDGVALNLDPRDDVDEPTLSNVLAHPADERWTGIVVHDHEPVQHLDLWLITLGSRFARLSVRPAARDAGIADPARRWAGATIYNDDSIAYLTLRPRTPTSDELGIVGHGPTSSALAANTVDVLHQWDQQRPAHPTITAQPAATPDQQRPTGYHIDRPNTRLTIAW
jgi:protein-L-isoaspartate(D-aspartate) O-methyltransferase